MRKPLFILLILVLNFCSRSFGQSKPVRHVADSVARIEMHLSAFGVEADSFPTIAIVIDFVNGYSKCVKSYFDPDIKPSFDTFSVEDRRKIALLFKNFDLTNLKAEYTVSRIDQPTSTTIIYIGAQKFVIKDYGLVGPYPLRELYKIAYKL